MRPISITPLESDVVIERTIAVSVLEISIVQVFEKYDICWGSRI